MSSPRPLLPTPDSTLPEAAWRREVATAIARLAPVTGEVTLKAGAAETAVADRRAGPASVVLFTALTASAAAAPRLWVSARRRGGFTIAHANEAGAAGADRRFAYAILGA